MRTAVVVLAGGGSRRLGRDKLAVPLAGSTVLEHLLSELDEALPDLPVVLVGPPRVTASKVTQVREVPPGGGPVAALACALQVPAVGSADLMGVIAGDQPFATAALVRLLDRSHELADVGPGGAPQVLLAVDPDGHRQPLLALYRVGPLRAAVAADPDGRSMRSVLALLRVVEVGVPARCTLDVDTPDDVDRVRRAAASSVPPVGGAP